MTPGTSGLASGVSYLLGDFDNTTYSLARIEHFINKAKEFVNNDLGLKTSDTQYITGGIGYDFNVTGILSGLLEFKTAALLARSSLATFARTSVTVREADSSISTGPRANASFELVRMLETDYQNARRDYELGLDWAAVVDRSHSNYSPSSGTPFSG